MNGMPWQEQAMANFGQPGMGQPQGGGGMQPGLRNLLQQMQGGQTAAPVTSALGVQSPQQAMTPTQQFDQSGPEQSSDWGEKLQGAGRAILGGLEGMDQRLNNVIYPSRATNQWRPNENPGLAGLMRQLEGYGGGYRGGR